MSSFEERIEAGILPFPTKVGDILYHKCDAETTGRIFRDVFNCWFGRMKTEDIEDKFERVLVESILQDTEEIFEDARERGEL